MPIFRPLLRLPGWVRVALPLALVACAAGLLTAIRQVEAGLAAPLQVTPTLAYHPILVRGSLDVPAGGETATFPFEPGQTLSDVLDGIGLEVENSRSLIDELGRFADLRRLRPRDLYSVRADGSRLVWFELVLSGKGAASAVRQADGSGWSGSWREFERAVRTHFVDGLLEGSLEGSIGRAGGDPRLAVLMSEVLQWDLDFTRDLRSGDRFEVLFEEVWRDREYQGPGEILALSYDNMGREIEAFRFGKEAGYYDGEGRPLKKMFLRSPMRFTRVTSKFSHRRFHPILKRYRPHYGIDYGAPTGTPVRVTANGVVSFAARKGGAGNMVKVRHPNGYLSAYLHLSRFAEGVRTGARVAQGDVIGYVGSTGLSTGPHLDYRVQKNGTWIDPMTLKSVPAQPISVALWADFEAYRNAARSALAQQVPFRSPSLSPRTDDGVRFAHQGGATDETSGARLETGSLPSVAGR